MKAAVLTVSDGVYEGTRADDSGDTLADLLTGAGFEVARSVVPDEPDAIERALGGTTSGVVLTTGGTGFAPRDVTPEATRRVLEREAPGIAAEAIGRTPATRTPHALLSRGARPARGDVDRQPARLAGGCRDGFAVLQPALGHALALAAGERDTGHRQT